MRAFVFDRPQALGELNDLLGAAIDVGLDAVGLPGNHSAREPIALDAAAKPARPRDATYEGASVWIEDV